MIDYAEASVRLRNLHRDADHCERSKMYSALVVELDDMMASLRDMYEFALVKRAEHMQERVREAA